MKKMLISAFMLLCFNNLNAQNIINGDFLINNGNDEPIGTCLGTFSSTSVPNWKRTHGTPNFVSCKTRDKNSIFVFHTQNEGEGIAGGYQFIPGETYKVKIAICTSGTAPFTISNKLVVKATSILPQNLPTVNTQCATTVPVLQPSDFELLQDVTSVPAPVNHENIVEFSFTMNNSPGVTPKQFIWIYPEAINNDLMTVVINSVSIQPQCKEAQYIHENTEDIEPIPEVVTNPHITPGVYAGYRHIYAGAPYTLPNKWVRVRWWNAHTIFVAKESITFSPVFEAATSAGSSFLAYIDPNVCFNDEAGGEQPEGEGKPGYSSWSQNGQLYSSEYDAIVNEQTKNSRKNRNILDNHSLSIYPNPTTGSFNIEIPRKGNYVIRVMNMMGATVYEGNLSGQQKDATIQLDNGLPAGNYTIHITGDGLRHVERITLIK